MTHKTTEMERSELADTVIMRES